MRKVKWAASFALFFLLGTFFFSSTANAYIDPSAMTYIVQIVVGIVIACGAAVGYYFKKIKRAFKKGDKPVESHTEQTNVGFDNDDEFDDSKLTKEEFSELNGKKQ